MRKSTAALLCLTVFASTATMVVPSADAGWLSGLFGGKKAKHTKGLSGKIRIDGSSTVFPITEAVAEEFQKVHHGVRVTVGISGTGGGFKKFCIGETDINDASRPVKGKEISKASKNNINFIELPVA